MFDLACYYVMIGGLSNVNKAMGTYILLRKPDFKSIISRCLKRKKQMKQNISNLTYTTNQLNQIIKPNSNKINQNNIKTLNYIYDIMRYVNTKFRPDKNKNYYVKNIFKR